MFKKPQRVRNWYPKHGEQSDAVEIESGRWLVTMRDFVYAREGTAEEQWIEKTSIYVPSITGMWYLLEPFTNFEGVAHPYFIFEYTDGSAVCFTIEGKRLNGESYSGVKGMCNGYELGYLWITERDCLTMPLTHGAKALYLYRLSLPPVTIQRICLEFLKDTHTLFERPEFYNTLFNNCTGRFAKTLRRAGVHAPIDISWYLPGFSDRYLARIGLIDSESPLRAPTRDLIAKKDHVWSVVESSPRALFKTLSF